MAFSWFLRKQKRSSSPEADLSAEAIILRVEAGLLMAFGPDGDPLPPELVRSICAADAGDCLKMETGQDVDQGHVLAILDAQQRGPLAEHRNSRWIKAMLGLSGSFEETSSDLLTAEPAGPTPPLPAAVDEDERPGSEWLTPLPFDKAEVNAMADADALLVHGLRDGMRLSTGRFDSMLNGWVVRPHQLPALAVKRSDGAAEKVEIAVTAVSTAGDGRQWPVTSRQVDLV